MPFDSTCRPNDITTQSAQRTNDMNEHILLPDGSIEKQTTTLNLGPTPATHGVFQNILELDGERIMKATSTVGYIHRAFEKLPNAGHYTRSPTDRQVELLLFTHQ